MTELIRKHGIKKLLAIVLMALVVGGGIGYAAEITVTALLKVVNGNFSLTRTVSNYQVDQTGTAVDYGIQSVAVGATNNLNIANVSTPGYIWLRNLDLTNDVYVTLTVKLRAGNIAIVPVSSTNMTTYSTAGTNDLEYWVNQE